MSEHHQIGDLLLHGVAPSVAESVHLADLGSFVAGRFGRYLHGMASPSEMGAHSSEFAANVSGRLGASTGTRWGQGMGLAESFLGSEWASWWQVASDGFASGYHQFDGDRTVLGLYEDAPVGRRTEAPSQKPARRRTSLFGRRDARRQLRPGRATGGSAVEQGTQYAFADGGTMAVESIDALESGGLAVFDQVALDSAGFPSAAGAVDGALTSGGAVARPPRSFGRQRPTSHNAYSGKGASRMISVDGMAVDDRTPALSGALLWAESVFGEHSVRGGGLSVSMAQVDRLAPNVATPISTRGDGQRRPVFAFFDSVEGAFLNLTSETAVAAAAQQVAQVEAQTSNTSRQLSFSNNTGSLRSPTPKTAAAPAERRATTGVAATSLATIAPGTNSSTTMAPALRPFVQGVFPTPVGQSRLGEGRGRFAGRKAGLSLATSVAYTGNGVAQPRIQRASMSSPLLQTVNLERVAAPSAELGRASNGTASVLGFGAAPVLGMGAGGEQSSALVAQSRANRGTHSQQWVNSVTGRAAMPLGSTLSRSEWVGAATALANTPSMAQSLKPFVPLVARRSGRSNTGFESRDFTNAIDGVVWVAPEAAGTQTPSALIGGDTQQAGVLMGLTAVPTDGAAVQVPASQVVAHSLRLAADSVGALNHAALSPFSNDVPSGGGASVSDDIVSEQFPKWAAAQLGDTWQQGVAESIGAEPVSRTARYTAVIGNRRLDDYFAAGVLPSEAAVERVVAYRPAAAVAGAAGLAAQLGAGGTPIGVGSSERSGDLVSRALGDLGSLSARGAGRWAEAESGGMGALQKTYDYGPGTYSYLAEDRRMLALAPAQEVALGAGASNEQPVAASRVAPSLFGQMPGVDVQGVEPASIGSFVAPKAHRLGAEARTQGIEAHGQVVSGSGVAAALAARHADMTSLVASPAVGWGRQPPGAEGKDVTPVRRPGARTLAARRMRQMLRRPVTTAAESRVVSASLARILPSHELNGSPASAWPMGRVDTEGQQVEPQLSTSIVARLNRRVVAMGLDSSRGIGVDGLSSTLARMDSVERSAVMQTLRRSGWTEPELRMLVMKPAESTESADSGPVGLPPNTGQAMVVGTTDASVVASVVDAGRTRRMTRNLARVVTGAEAVAIGRAGIDSVSGDIGTLAAALYSVDLALLDALKSDGYFGGLGVGAAASKAAASYSLRDAVGELLTVAREMVADSTSTAAASARSEGLRRVARVRNELQMATSSAAIMALPDGLQQVLNLANSVAETVGKQDALAEEIAAKASRAGTFGVDTSEMTTASEASRPSLANLIGGAEQALLRQQAHAHVGAAEDVAQSSRAPGGAKLPSASLNQRLETALGLSSRGPAGVRRLLRTLDVANVGSPTRTSSATFADDDARFELATSPSLDGAIAPEFMLGSIRTPEIAGATNEMEMHRRWMRGDLTQVLAGAEAGRHGVSSEGFVGLTAALPREHGVQASARTRPARMATAGRSVARASQRGFARGPLQVLLAMTQNADVPANHGNASFGTATVDGTGTQQLATRAGAASGPERAAVLKALLRGQGGTDVVSLFQKAGASDFAYAWLNRVDGTKSGLDLGLGDTRAAVQKTFGSSTGHQRASAIADRSPIASANLVSPGGSAQRDASGLRQLASSVVGRRNGRGGARHAASAAFQRTDWRFVQTGSQASTSHANLGKLASAIASNSESAGRAPMPLVAPAVKAVAQSALRSATTEKRAASSSSSASQGADNSSGTRAKQSDTMSETGIEMLAIEMASRVSRLLGLKQERIGVWQ